MIMYVSAAVQNQLPVYIHNGEKYIASWNLYSSYSGYAWVDMK